MPIAYRIDVPAVLIVTRRTPEGGLNWLAPVCRIDHAE
jgi:hypothetical protein